MRPLTLLSVVPLCLVLLCVAPATAQFPAIMNYQVMLTDDLDQPLANQSVNLVFRLYEVEFGGAAAWTETHNTATNSIGVVSVVLGSANPLPLETFTGLFWLQVDVDGETMSPRRRLTAAPYALSSFDSFRLAGHPSADFATDAELSASGTINNPLNPVDWTKLKSVPAGFADGTDDVGGSGDGHSLDAYDGDPVDAVWVAANGKVGIGTTDPSATLHVHRDTLNTTTLKLTNTESGTGALDGLQMYLSAFGGGAGITNYEGAPIYIGTGGASGLTIRSDSSVDIGNGVSQPGQLEIYGSTSYLFALHRSYEDADGGQFELKDEAGAVAVAFGADPSHTGGRLLVSRDGAYGPDKGIDLNGNWASSEEPALRILGSARSALFYMNQSGNGSVRLPADAIYNDEILDEPGVASDLRTSSIGLATSYTTICVRSIVVPASGYVLAMADCQIRANHATGTTSDADLGVSDTNSGYPTNQGIAIALDPDIPSGNYDFPGSYHGLFEVAGAGTYTYYFLGREYAGSIQIWDAELSLIYFPTAYGVVDPAFAGDARGSRDEGQSLSTPLTDADIAAERTEAEAFNLARIERELAAIQAQVEAMKEERQ